MPEQYKSIKPKWQGDEHPSEKILALGRKITDSIPHKLKGITSQDPEYWGLREMVTDEMADVALRMKIRVHYVFDELLKMNPEYQDDPKKLQKLLDEMRA